MRRTRLDPEQRKADILEVAIKMAVDGHFSQITRHEVAVRLSVSPSLIMHHWGTIDDLKNQVIVEGCRRLLPRIILIGLSTQHPSAVSLSDSIKQHAATNG